MEDDQNYGDDAENVAQGTQNQTDLSAEFAAMRAELEAMKSQQYVQQQAAQAPEPQIPQLTAEQAQALKDNPALMASWLQSQAENAKQEIRKESSKQVWDRRTEDKFPLIKTDKEFQKRVTAQMREMTAFGEYKKDDPMLLYRATQIAASEYVPNRSNASKNAQSQSSIESRQTMSRQDAGTKTKIDENDPRLHFAKVLGLTGEKLKKFKEGLGPYVASQRRQGRRLSK
jgi:hypothetical protein